MSAQRDNRSPFQQGDLAQFRATLQRAIDQHRPFDADLCPGALSAHCEAELRQARDARRSCNVRPDYFTPARDDGRD